MQTLVLGGMRCHLLQAPGPVGLTNIFWLNARPGPLSLEGTQPCVLLDLRWLLKMLIWNAATRQADRTGSDSCVLAPC